VFNSSLSWTEELARYAFIWMNMFGASIVVKKNSNATIEFFGKMLRGRARTIQQFIVKIAIIVGELIIIIEGIKMIGIGMGQLSAAMGIPKSIIYLAVPIGGVGMLIHSISDFAAQLTGLSSGAKGAEN
jgi:TRAP-type C4-dicarboxylate transport system permease small subunit